MLGNIVLMLLWTFGLSRLLLYVLPRSVAARKKIAIANLGSLALIAFVYIILVIAEPSVTQLLVVAIPFAAASQALWYWRDISKLPLSSELVFDQTRPQQGIFQRVFLRRPSASQPERDRDSGADRWNALLRYDDEIRKAAEKLRPYGDHWVSKLGDDFIALNEDRKYLTNIVDRLVEEAKQAEALRWRDTFRQTFDGEVCTEESLKILRELESRGYTLGIADSKTITATKGQSTSYFRSNGDIKWFGQGLLGKQ